MGFEEALRRRSTPEINQEAIRSKNFERQWASPLRMQVGEQMIDTYFIKPENPKTDVPTLVVPGWGATTNRFKENLRTVVSAGRSAISVNAPHGVGHEFKSPGHMNPIADAELRRIAAFMAGLDLADVQKTDAIGHSEGGLDILLAAAMYPERFRNIVLINPAGMIGKDNFLPLAVRFNRDQLTSYVRGLFDGTFSKRKAIAREGMKVAFLNPIQSLKEVQAIAAADVVELLRYVKSLGVGVLIIHGAGDAAFPMPKMQRSISKEIERTIGPKPDANSESDSVDVRLKKIGDQVLDGFIAVKGSHNDFVVRAPEYTRIAEGFMSTMEEKQTKIKE